MTIVLILISSLLDVAAVFSGCFLIVLCSTWGNWFGVALGCFTVLPCVVYRKVPFLAIVMLLLSGVTAVLVVSVSAPRSVGIEALFVLTFILARPLALVVDLLEKRYVGQISSSEQRHP